MTNESRYEISTYIGPCTEQEAITLGNAILDLPQFQAVGGGGIAIVIYADEEDNSSAQSSQSSPGSKLSAS